VAPTRGVKGWCVVTEALSPSGPAPYCREAGSGTTVLCLHSNASTSGQWRGLMDLLAPRWHVMAPDQLGAGRSPPWPADRRVTLADEVALLAPVLQRASPRFHLIGHSYGAALAVRLALSCPERVASLLLFEPTLFGLLEQAQPGSAAVQGIGTAVAGAVQAVQRGDMDSAARCFIDYWMGTGAWDATPEARRGPIAASMGPIGGWSQALMTEPLTLADVARLRMPVRLLGGATSTAAAQSVLALLQQAWPSAVCTVMPGVGHMGPVTHAAAVNALILDFLQAQGLL